MAKLVRTAGEWGVELVCQVGDSGSIRAILAKRPTGGVKTEISFSGVPPGQALTLVEAQAWLEAFHQVLAEARKEALGMKP